MVLPILWYYQSCGITNLVVLPNTCAHITFDAVGTPGTTFSINHHRINMRLAHVCMRYSRCGHVYTKSSDNILICAQYMILVGIIRASLVIVLLLLASFYRDNRTAAQYLCAGSIVVVVLETVVCMYDHARDTIHKEDLPHS